MSYLAIGNHPPFPLKVGVLSLILRVRMVHITLEKEGLTITNKTFLINNKQYEYSISDNIVIVMFFPVHFTATKQYIIS